MLLEAGSRDDPVLSPAIHAIYLVIRSVFTVHLGMVPNIARLSGCYGRWQRLARGTPEEGIHRLQYLTSERARCLLYGPYGVGEAATGGACRHKVTLTNGQKPYFQEYGVLIRFSPIRVFLVRFETDMAYPRTLSSINYSTQAKVRGIMYEECRPLKVLGPGCQTL